MQRVIILVKRKSSMSQKAFREYYEAQHAFLGPKYLGGILTGFQRYYVDKMSHLPTHWNDIPGQMAAAEPVSWGFDAIGIYTLRDENAVADFIRVMSDPEVAQIIFQDEAQFMDRPSCLMAVADGVEGEGMVSEEGRAIRAGLGLTD